MDGLAYIREMADNIQHEPGASAPSSATTTATGIPADSAYPAWLSGLPAWARPYATLSRFDRPIGIWLLALPCWIGLVFTAVGTGFSPMIFVWAWLFFIGAIPMRGAGCTWNDIQDRAIDGEVARTAARPLPSGQVSLSQAYIWMAIQLLAGFFVWIFLPLDAKIIALLAMPLVIAYPYMKRVTWWPQAFLGIVFNVGVLIAAATLDQVRAETILLWFGLICWTIAYDTIYATQDIEDDALIGVRSTARLFGDRAVLGAFGFHLAAAGLIALAGLAIGAEQVGAITIIAFVLHGVWQAFRMRNARDATALAVFKSNVWAGAILVAGFAVAALL
ncbi:MAG: 4-hydroxybenzoate octaprenyltransferase [Pseudomonadota bacterium]